MEPCSTAATELRSTKFKTTFDKIWDKQSKSTKISIKDQAI